MPCHVPDALSTTPLAATRPPSSVVEVYRIFSALPGPSVPARSSSWGASWVRMTSPGVSGRLSGGR